MKFCLMGCGGGAVGGTGFCSEEHSLKYCNAALDTKFRYGAGLPSTMQAVMGEKTRIVAERKKWKLDNPGKQLRYR